VAAYALVFVAAFAISFVVTYVLTRVAPRLGLLDHPSERKMHTKVTPVGGGIGIFLGVALTVGVGLIGAYVLSLGPRPAWMSEALWRHLPNAYTIQLPYVVAILGGAAVLFVIGLLDDILGLRPLVKLVAEVCVAVAVVLVGVRATMYMPNPWISGLITVAWIVGITNSFNLLDNMDGLSAGVASIISAIFLVVAIQTDQMFITCFLLALMGAMIAFLLFNFPPAKIFMGDCGSLVIGFLLATLTVVFTFRFQKEPSYQPSQALVPVVLPLIIFAVPIYDTISVIFIRLRENRNIFEADKKHFSHRLIDLGMSTREAVLSIYLFTFALGISATYLYFLNVPGAVAIFLQVVALIVLIILLEKAGKRRMRG